MCLGVGFMLTFAMRCNLGVVLTELTKLNNVTVREQIGEVDMKNLPSANGSTTNGEVGIWIEIILSLFGLICWSRSV